MWSNPLPYMVLRKTSDAESFKTMPWWPMLTTGVPVVVDLPHEYTHPGAFGAYRKYDVHTGVDLYVPECRAAFTVEAGTVVGLGTFTGPSANPPSPWWNDSSYIMIEGESGVVCYGEIHCSWHGDGRDMLGHKFEAGDLVGFPVQVLKKDKGRPTRMLHLELYKHGYRGEPVDWALGAPQPSGLLDPTPYLLELCEDRA